MKTIKFMFPNPPPLILFGLSEGIKQAGHESYVFYGDERIFDKSPDEQLTKIENKINEYKPDIFMLEGYANCPIKGISEICKRHSIPIFFWGIEDVPGDTKITEYYLPYASKVFTTTIENIPYYKHKYNIDADILLFGVNPEFHKFMPPEDKYTHDICFCGSNYSSRYHDTKDYIIDKIIKNNYDFAIYGHDWWINRNLPVNICNYRKVYKGLIPYQYMPILYSSSKIAIGMNCDRNSITQKSQRMCEILGTGGSIMISPWSKSQEFEFGISGDIAFFPKSPSEMQDNIDYILNKMTSEERKDMAIKAQQRVYEHCQYKDKAPSIIKAYNNL